MSLFGNLGRGTPATAQSTGTLGTSTLFGTTLPQQAQPQQPATGGLFSQTNTNTATTTANPFGGSLFGQSTTTQQPQQQPQPQGTGTFGQSVLGGNTGT